MRIDILTLFPGMFRGPFEESIIKRAVERRLVEINLYNFREWATDRHKTVDDYPYGGGAGMVLKPEPIFRAVEAITGLSFRPTPEVPQPKRLVPPDTAIILMSPQGRVFNQEIARELARLRRLILICGHYEGFDDRVRHLVTDELSIGDYVLTGGELPAMVIVDAVVRLVPGVLGAEEAPLEESFSDGLLEYPQYTRPADFRGWKVPEVLLSGHHGRIRQWRREQALLRTFFRRPDLLEKAKLTAEERRLIEFWRDNPPESPFDP